MNNTTITETFELPSRGLIYGNPFDARFKMHSMTTEDEMARTSPTDMPYKAMCDIIENCLDEKFPIPVYDMCLGDYQYLLHKMRIVTYGSDYKMYVTCSKCGSRQEVIFNLDDLEEIIADPEVFNNREIELPRSKNKVKLAIQTPRLLDKISLRVNEIKKKTKSSIDQSYIVTLTNLIEAVDGRYLNDFEKEEFVRKLPMLDANLIIQKAEKLNGGCGLASGMSCQCNNCNHEIVTTFRLTSEFFGPTIY